MKKTLFIILLGILPFSAYCSNDMLRCGKVMDGASTEGIYITTAKGKFSPSKLSISLEISRREPYKDGLMQKKIIYNFKNSTYENQLISFADVSTQPYIQEVVPLLPRSSTDVEKLYSYKVAHYVTGISGNVKPTLKNNKVILDLCINTAKTTGNTRAFLKDTYIDLPSSHVGFSKRTIVTPLDIPFEIKLDNDYFLTVLINKVDI